MASDLGIALTIIAAGGYLGARPGRRVRWVRAVRLDTLLCLALPSLLVHLAWLSAATVKSLQSFMDRTDLLGWVISLPVLSGFAQIDWEELKSLAFRLVAPVVVGTLAALGVVWGASALLRIDARSVLLLQVAPMMSGGLTAGILPLSVGYANLSGLDQGALRTPNRTSRGRLTGSFGPLLRRRSSSMQPASTVFGSKGSQVGRMAKIPRPPSPPRFCEGFLGVSLLR